MAWEKRKHSCMRYYTQTYRAGKKRRRLYFGRGQIAELASAQDLLRRIERELAWRGGEPGNNR